MSGEIEVNPYPARYEMLDAFRGLAALAVVFHHVTHIHVGGPAVMVFFVISGYCIAAAGNSCRRAGAGLGTFMARRIRRIFPPYLLSIFLWAALRVVKWKVNGPNELARPWLEWVQNLTLTQWVSLIPNPGPYPPQNPTLFVSAYWSLCYEEQFYLVMGLVVALMGLGPRVARAIVIGLLGIGLAWNVKFPHTVYGVFIEYWAPFAFGVLAFDRLCVLTREVHRRLIDALLVCVLAVSGVLLWQQGWPAPDEYGSEFRTIPGELVVSSAFALVLIAVRRWDGWFGSSLVSRPLLALGKITFSLYLTHQIVLGPVFAVGERFFGDGFSVPAVVLRIALHIGIAGGFWWWCERPFLNAPLRKRDDRPAAKEELESNSMIGTTTTNTTTRSD